MLAGCPRGSHRILHIDFFVWDVCRHDFHRRFDKNISHFHAYKKVLRDSFYTLTWLFDVGKWNPPPQAQQTDCCKLCRQICFPPKAWHVHLRLLWWQIRLPLHSQQISLCLPCLHFLFPLYIFSSSKHFEQRLVNCAVRLLILKHSKDKGACILYTVFSPFS